MTSLLVCLASAVLAAEGAALDNPVVVELVKKGVLMSDGSAVKLPAPALADGLDEEAQRAAIGRIAANHSVEDLLRNSLVAPFELSMRSIKTPAGQSPARGVDLWFVAYGDWETLGSQEFLEGMTKRGERSNPNGQLAQSGFLDAAALAKHKIELASQADREERYFYATACLFDRVELTATRYTLLTRKPDSFLVGTRLDPRFNDDPQHPNQWRSMVQDLDNPQKVTYGPPRLYTSAGSYGKVTRLAKPAGAVFLEYHLVFEEPQGWFKGANLLRSKLPLIAQDEVRSFRRKLKTASAGK